MADLTAIFFILLIIGIAYPALLTAWWLLFPAAVERARMRMQHTPGASFWMGLAALIGFLIPIMILFNLPSGFFKFLGFVAIGVLLVLASLGAAGLAARFADKLNRIGNFSAIGSFVRGAVIIELASILPVVGWFVFLPIALVTTLGASVFAMLNWTPKSAAPAVEIPAQA
ncbi:MAG: hypothetical protein HFACDABA_01458 [Anaerolineales bacterium]|nr:hypothetical protein [Anaerolineales bacterium]